MSVQTRAPLASGDPPINFRAHEVRAGTAGARDEFEEMIGMLVRCLYRGARLIKANPGDWGIDALVGDLGGTVVIWQAKYYMPAVTESHQQEIRDSFASAIRAASEHGHRIRQWTLCVPSSLDAKTDKWWSGWKKRSQRDTGVTIELWHEVELKTRLISPDAADVRRHYYDPYDPSAGTPNRDRATVVQVSPETAEELDTALFVRQLREAGHHQVDVAKLQFFNAELLAREIVDKAVPSELSALTEADATVHGIWESHFNDACVLRASMPALPGLHTEVMREVRAAAGSPTWPLRAGVVHGCGLMHRVVEDSRAGWVVHWKDVAAEHRTDGRSQANATAGAPLPAGPAEGREDSG